LVKRGALFYSYLKNNKNKGAPSLASVCMALGQKGDPGPMPPSFGDSPLEALAMRGGWAQGAQDARDCFFSLPYLSGLNDLP